MSKQVNIQISADSSQAEKALANTSKSLGKLNKQAGASGKAMAGMAVAGGAVGAVIGSVLTTAINALGASLDGAIKRLDSLNNFPRVMSNLGISASQSQKAIQVLSDKLVGLPTSLDSASLSVQRFTSANSNLEASTAIFLALNNAILAGGAPMQMQAEAIEQISQAYTKGRFDVMEWRAMMSAMPAQLKQVATSLGYTSTAVGGDLHTALSNGTLSMNDFMNAIVRLNREGVAGFPSFEQQARNSTNGVATSMQNLKVAFTRGLADIMNAIGQSNIAGFFNGIANAVNAVMPYIVGFVKVCSMAVQSIARMFGGGENSKQLETSVDKVADSMQNAGASAGGISGGLASANKQAKALGKQLAGFDEMNVITEKPSASAGGGGGGAGGANIGAIDIDTQDLFKNLDKGASKADQVAKKIKESFESVFASLKDSPALQSIGETWTKIGERARSTFESIAPDLNQGFENLKEANGLFWDDMFSVMDEKLPLLMEKLDTFFASIHNTMAPALQLCASIWEGFTETLKKFWEEHGKNILEGISDFFIKTQEIFNKIQTEIIEPIVKPALEEFQRVWEENLKPTIDNVADFVGRLIEFGLRIYNEFIQPIIVWLVEHIAPVVVKVGNTITSIISGVARFISGVINTVTNIFQGVLTFLEGVFAGNWEKAWTGIKDTFGSVFEGVKQLFKTPINWIIKGINKFIRGLNTLTIPDWVPGVGGKGFHLNEIPELARGGVVDGATYAMIGEAGAEAVMPLEHNTEWIDKLANRIANNIGGANAPTQVVVKIGEDTLVDKIIEGINNQTFMQGSSVINI